MLILKKRKKTGSRKSNYYRSLGYIIGNLYNSQESLPIYIEKLDKIILENLIEDKINKLECVIDNNKINVIVKDIQIHPYKKKILHIDLYKTNKKYVKMDLKINFINIKEAIGIKKGGFFVNYFNKIKVKINSLNIIDNIKIDVKNLDINKPLFLSDLKLEDSIKKDVKQLRSNPVIAIILGSKNKIINQEEKSND